jgi:hypothetical protein
MDVLDAISCVFLFMAAGPFLEKLFLTSARPRTILQRPHKKELAQECSVLGPFSAGVNFKTKAAKPSRAIQAPSGESPLSKRLSERRVYNPIPV